MFPDIGEGGESIYDNCGIVVRAVSPPEREKYGRGFSP